VQTKDIGNIFNKIITENFPNLKSFAYLVQEAFSTLSRLDKNRTNAQNVIIKTTSTEIRERILKAIRQKKNEV
jgi:hypothetical protein